MRRFALLLRIGKRSLVNLSMIIGQLYLHVAHLLTFMW